ncbi:MAG: CRISPR-associated endonuclease Cas3'', partial [Selenomonadaceae bacterium]
MSYEKKIAHILVDESSGEIKAEQTVLEHLKGTADLARKFGEAFGIPKIAEQCALYHDVGKYSDKFQKYIRGELNARVDHSTAGAKLLYNKGMWQLACAIAGHHAGLPDVGTPSDIADKSSFLGRMKRDDLLDCTSYLNELSDPEKCDFYDEEIKEINPRCSMDMTLLVRMIFSCLVDADFIDTEKFMRLGEVKRGNFAGVAELCDGLICKLKGNGFFNSKNVLNEKRTEILRRCMKMAEQRPGIFTLTVPTGGGKTLSSLAFALLHAKKYGKERIIYVIPYT